MRYFAGLDWGGAAHAVAVVDETGRTVARFDARHDAAGLADLLVRLKRLASPAELAVAVEAGVCPVTHQSGKRRGVTFRWACNHRLRQAITCFADNSRHACAWAAASYARARQRGCKHPHAIRILARAWIRILWRAWTNNTPYNPAAHRAAATTR